jgi:hypothetical protein
MAAAWQSRLHVKLRHHPLATAEWRTSGEGASTPWTSVKGNLADGPHSSGRRKFRNPSAYATVRPRETNQAHQTAPAMPNTTTVDSAMTYATGRCWPVLTGRLHPATAAARIAASLRSTRLVTKADAPGPRGPNGSSALRLILPVNIGAGIPFRRSHSRGIPALRRVGPMTRPVACRRRRFACITIDATASARALPQASGDR